MRTTVDLPPAVHRRAKVLADQRHQSLSAVLADLAMRGLAQLDDEVHVRAHPDTGVPTISLGRPVSSEDVARFLDEE